jgi:hypothetical protein
MRWGDAGVVGIEGGLVGVNDCEFHDGWECILKQRQFTYAGYRD